MTSKLIKKMVNILREDTRLVFTDFEVNDRRINAFKIGNIGIGTYVRFFVLRYKLWFSRSDVPLLKQIADRLHEELLL